MGWLASRTADSRALRRVSSAGRSGSRCPPPSRRRSRGPGSYTAAPSAACGYTSVTRTVSAVTKE
eukprot:931249-Pyramimonas_sp.AAC.1